MQPGPGQPVRRELDRPGRRRRPVRLGAGLPVHDVPAAVRGRGRPRRSGRAPPCPAIGVSIATSIAAGAPVGPLAGQEVGLQLGQPLVLGRALVGRPGQLEHVDDGRGAEPPLDPGVERRAPPGLRRRRPGHRSAQLAGQRLRVLGQPDQPRGRQVRGQHDVDLVRAATRSRSASSALDLLGPGRPRRRRPSAPAAATASTATPTSATAPRTRLAPASSRPAAPRAGRAARSPRPGQAAPGWPGRGRVGHRPPRPDAARRRAGRRHRVAAEQPRSGSGRSAAGVLAAYPRHAQLSSSSALGPGERDVGQPALLAPPRSSPHRRSNRPDLALQVLAVGAAVELEDRQ